MIASAPMRSRALLVNRVVARGAQPARREQPQAMRDSTLLTTTTTSIAPPRQLLARHRRGSSALTRAARGGPPPPGSPGDIDVRIRSEVEAPFRTVRLVLFGFFAGSASVGAAIALTQVAGALFRAQSGDAGSGGIALPDAATSLAVDLGAVALFAFLFSRDWKARERQIARLQREADLGALRLRLATGARRRLASLRGFARPVIVAGTRAQVEAAVAAAEPLREQLEARGVLIVPVPFLGDGDDGDGDRAASGGEASTSSSSDSAKDAKADLRWKAQPLDAAAWRRWFEDQAKLAKNAKLENGLYVGLRIDGRVRASGSGCPPWAAFAVQLPEMEGVFKGFGDGFDGRV